jgi:hypothetical protein
MTAESARDEALRIKDESGLVCWQWTGSDEDVDSLVKLIALARQRPGWVHDDGAAFATSSPPEVYDPDKFIDQMVERFLLWPLPKDFAPDCGINFDGRKPDAMGYTREWPVGTNLLTATQARQMIEYLLAAAPKPGEGT